MIVFEHCINFLGNGSDNEPAYKVPVGCEDQVESAEDTPSNKTVQPYEITRVQTPGQDLRRLSSKYIQPNKGEGILEYASKSQELGKESQY